MRPAPASQLAVWQAVADHGKPVDLHAIEDMPGVAASLSAAHLTCATVLAVLVRSRFLATQQGSRSVWWFGVHCRLPVGARLAPPWGGPDVSLPTARSYDLTSTLNLVDGSVSRAGSQDWQQFPSRMGDRLHYRNGLVTDLDGNVIRKADR